MSTIDFEGSADMAATNLVRVDPDGSVSVAAEGLLFPNGSVITPDGSTLIVAESWGQRLTAFDLEPDGSLANRREWARFAPPQAADASGQPAQWSCAPDGIALDAEGAVWVADAANKRAVWVREGGQLLEGNICALLAAKDHLNIFLYDGGIVPPDPEGIITGGHQNKFAAPWPSARAKRSTPPPGRPCSSTSSPTTAPAAVASSSSNANPLLSNHAGANGR